MTKSETEILCYFRRYQVSAGEMLFFDTGPAKSHSSFRFAMASLIRSGLVIEERRSGAYSLTPLGYQTSLSAEPA